MELDIAALSMGMASAQLQQGVSISMMKKTMFLKKFKFIFSLSLYSRAFRESWAA